MFVFVFVFVFVSLMVLAGVRSLDWAALHATRDETKANANTSGVPVSYRTSSPV